MSPAAQDAIPEAKGILHQHGSLANKTAPSGGWIVSHSPGVSAVLTLFKAPEFVQQKRQARPPEYMFYH